MLAPEHLSQLTPDDIMDAATVIERYQGRGDEAEGASRSSRSAARSAGARPGVPWLCLEEGEEEKEEGRRNGRFGHKLNSRAWANLTDLPIIVFRSPIEFCPLGFRAYTDPLEIHCAVK